MNCFPSIHPSVSSSIHGWHHTWEKTLVEINNPPSAHVSLSRKGMPGPRVSVSLKQRSSHGTMSTNVCSYSYLSEICNDNQRESRLDIEQHWGIFVVSGLFSWLVVCCYLTGHKQCKHQDFQWPWSQWIHSECGI